MYLFFFACLFASCKDKETDEPLITPDCIQAIIDDLQANDTDPDCLASVKRYTFAGATVFETQTDACLDGEINIIDEDCMLICTISGLEGSQDCGNSSNFYDEAELLEVVWEEEN